MEGLSHITDASPVENFVPLARPKQRKSGFTKAAIASAASMAALAMFAPKAADANQVTITAQGTFTSGSDTTNVPGSTQGVFGPTGSLVGKQFTVVYTFDDTKGTPYPATGTPTSDSGTGVNSPGTATLTVEGASVSVASPGTSPNTSASRSIGATQSTVAAGAASGTTGSYVDISAENNASNPQFTKSPDWRSGLTFAPLSNDITSGSSFAYYKTVTGGRETASGGMVITQLTISSASAVGIEPGKGQGTQQALCGCDGKPVNPTAGDPINIASGNVVLPVTDYQSGGINQLEFVRTYNSMGSSYATFATTLGTGWRSNYDRYLNTSAISNTPGVVTAERADGQYLTFTNSGSGWFADADTDITLSQSGSGSGSTWTLKDHNDVTETYNDLGTGEAQLTSITQRNGYSLTLGYTSGQLTTVTDNYTPSHSLTLAYSGGLLNTVTTPGGLVMTYGYGASGLKGATDDLLTSVSYNTSPATSQTYKYELTTTQPLLLTGIVDENGNRAATWAYDSMGRATSSERFKDTAATMPVDVESISYNNTTGQRTVTNPLGLPQTYTYVVDHGLPKVSEIDRAATTGITPASRTFGYDTNGFQDCSTQWIGTAAICSSVSTGDATQVTNNAHGSPTSVTEAYGSAIARTTSITYDSTFVHLPSVITEPSQTPLGAPNSRITSFTYDGSGNVLTKTVEDYNAGTGTERQWTYGWNSTGEMTSATGPTPNGASAAQNSAMTYDTSGNLLTSTLTVNSSSGSNIVTNFTSYDPDGRLKGWTDPNGLITAYTYDTRGHLLTQSVGTTATSGGTEVTTLMRDAAENITQVTKPDGSYLAYTLDAANRVTSVTDALGEHIDYTLDTAGNKTATKVYSSPGTTALNRSHSSGFDALSRRTSDTDAYSNATTYTYDSNSNLKSVADPYSNTTAYNYDALNRVNQVTDPVSNVTTIAYSPDTRNLPSLVVDPNGFHTTYNYDGFGGMTRVSSPDSGPTDYTYDNAGNVATKEDANGNTTTYTAYDSLNRIKTVTYADTTQSHYYYDTAANSIGRLKQVADPTPAGQPSNATYFGYDWYGNVTSKQTGLSGQNYAATYNPATNQLTSETYDSGMVVGYKYDAAGQMKEVDINGSWMLHDATHQPFGPVSGWTWGNGTGTSYARTFDSDGRMTGYPLDGTYSRAVGYDYASRVTSITDTVPTSQSIGYDADSRITSYSGPYGNGSFSGVTYDANGNRKSIPYTSATETDTITSGSNVLAQTKLGSAAAITYTTDGAGNVTGIGSTTYTYDARNRQSTETGSVSTTYYYDGLNERIETLTPPPGQLWRNVIAPSTPEQIAAGFSSAANQLTSPLLTSTRELGNYFWSGSGVNSVLSETVYLDHAGTAAAFGAIPVAVNANGGTGAHPWNSVRVYTDQQGTPRRLVDQSLNLFGKWDSDPFGVGAWNYNPAGNGAIYIDQRFPGQSSDDAFGTYFNTTRNYYPNIGRYLQSDPIGLAGAPSTAVNTYAYVGNDPANAVDPRGMAEQIPFQNALPSYTGGMGTIASQQALSRYEGQVNNQIGRGVLLGLQLPLLSVPLVGEATEGATLFNFMRAARLSEEVKICEPVADTASTLLNPSLSSAGTYGAGLAADWALKQGWINAWQALAIRVGISSIETSEYVDRVGVFINTPTLGSPAPQ